jgi:alcohol dehydrogenase YqhD (iron-dependent ADH family)
MTKLPKRDPRYELDDSPQAIDLIATEDEIASLNAQIKDLDGQRFLIPGQKKKRKSALEQRRSVLQWKESVEREFVFYNPTSSEIYNSIHRQRKEKAEAEAAAGSGSPTTPTPPDEGGGGFNGDDWLLKRKLKRDKPKL